MGLILPDNARSEATRLEIAALAARDTYIMAGVVGFHDITPGLHLEMARWIDGPSKRKLGLVPRDHLKTSLWTIANAVRRVAADPNTRILIGNETATNASHFLRRIEAVFDRNTLFQWLFPHLIPDPGKKTKWSETEMLIPREIDYPEATIETIGVGGAVVSRHYKLIKLDDLVGKEASESPEVMKKTIDWYQYAESLLEQPSDEIQTYGTRWAWDDLYSWSEKHERGLDMFFRQVYGPDGAPIWPQRFGAQALDDIRYKIGSFKFSCNPAEAPVLLSDFTEKPIAQIEVGDEVVGYTFGDEQQQRLCKATVLAKGSRRAMVYRITLRTGKVIRCTINHKWYTGRYTEGRSAYEPVKLGRDLLFISLTTPEVNLRDWAYLAAMVDGEGHCDHSCIQITQSKTKNPDVCQRIEETLERLRIDYEIWEDERKPGCLTYTLKGRRQLKIDLLRNGRPGKSQEILNSIWERPAKPICFRDEVVSIEPDREEEVYSFETTSGNYVIWGLASKNCQYLNKPSDPESSSFKEDWLRFYERRGDEVVTPSTGGRVPIQELRRTIRVDPAISEKAGAARSALIVDGVAKDERVYVLEAWAKRCQPFEMIEQIFKYWEQYEPDAVGIESIAYQRILKPVLEYEAEKRGIWINVVELKPDTKDRKTNRIRGKLQPYLERGLIWVNADQEDLLDEYRMFPNGPTLDLLDALAYGPDMWTTPLGEEETAEDAAAAADFENEPTRDLFTGY